MEEWYAVSFAQVVVFCYCLCLVFAYIKKRFINKPLLIFCQYVAFTIIISWIIFGFFWGFQFYSYYIFILPFITYFKIEDTAFLFVLYYLNNTLMLGRLYKAIIGNARYSRMLTWVIFLVFVLEILIYIFIDGYNKPGKLNVIVDALFCSGVPLTYIWIWNHRGNNAGLPLKRNVYFLISLGLVVQNVLALFYFFVMEKLYQTDPNLYYLSTSIKSVVQIFAIGLFMFAIYQSRYVRFLGIVDDDRQ